MPNLIVVYSQIEAASSVKNRILPIVDNYFSKNSEIKFLGCFESEERLRSLFRTNEELKQPTVIINSSGGTESLIDVITKACESPVLILADSDRNSFASSLEAFAFLKDNYSIKTIYCETDEEKFLETEKFLKAVNSISKIDEINFGLIGEPSDWLLTSQGITGFGNFKTHLKKIAVEELIQLVEQVSNDDAATIVNEWVRAYSQISVDENSLYDSARVYLALKKLSEKYSLQVLSIRCFDLLQHNYTACMGISKFNDDGLTSGCEGDIPTTFTMMIAQQLTGKSVWMANPSSIKKEKNEIIFAHCTVPSTFLSDTSKSGLTTHMESGLSTAIRGPLTNSVVTVMRINSKFDKITAMRGRITQSDMQDENLCRTQAAIKIETNVEKWINNVAGNHQVIVYGDIIDELKYFCDFTKIKLINLD